MWVVEIIGWESDGGREGVGHVVEMVMFAGVSRRDVLKEVLGEAILDFWS